MSRPISYPTAGAALHALLGADPPPWVSPTTVGHARALLASLRADVARATAGATRRDAAEVIGAGDGSWKRWTGLGGWLSPLE